MKTITTIVFITEEKAGEEEPYCYMDLTFPIAKGETICFDDALSPGLKGSYIVEDISHTIKREVREGHAMYLKHDIEVYLTREV